MGQIIPTYQDQPRFTETLTLDSEQFVLTFTYRPRLNAWYWDLTTLEGTPLASGRRLSPGWDQLLGLVPESGRPAGYLFCRGNDPYTREMLGNRVLPVYYSTSEVVAPDSSSGLRVAII